MTTMLSGWLEAKEQERDEYARLVDEFIARGGEIQQPDIQKRAAAGLNWRAKAVVAKPDKAPAAPKPKKTQVAHTGRRDASAAMKVRTELAAQRREAMAGDVKRLAGQQWTAIEISRHLEVSANLINRIASEFDVTFVHGNNRNRRG